MVLGSVKIAAYDTDGPVSSLSQRTSIPSAELQLFIFGQLLTVLFRRMWMHCLAYYFVQIEYE